MALPKTLQVGRYLDGSLIRREQVQDQRNPPSSDRRALAHTEEILYSRRDPGRLSIDIVHFNRPPGFEVNSSRRHLFQQTQLFRRHHTLNALSELAAFDGST